MHVYHYPGCIGGDCNCVLKRHSTPHTDYELSRLTTADLVDLITRASKQLSAKMQTANYSTNQIRAMDVNGHLTGQLDLPATQD